MKSIIKLNKKLLSLVLLTLVLFNLKPTNQQAICTYDMLIYDILGDLSSNGKLECLLDASDTNVYVWKSDCGLRWKRKLWPAILGTYKLEGLYTSAGVKTKKLTIPFDDQSSICQLVRALMYEGKMSFKVGLDDIQTIRKEILNTLKCIGNDGQTSVCVATGSSFNDVNSVVPFVTGDTIRINNIPSYVQNNNISNLN